MCINQPVNIYVSVSDQFANVIAKQPTFPSATIMNAEQVTSYEKCTFIQDVERPKDNYTGKESDL